MDESPKEKKSQSIILENRENLEVTGVDEVSNFDEQQISAITDLGLLLIKGSCLQVQKFNTKTKDLKITGKIDELKYSDNKKHEHKNFFSKIFK